MKEKSLMVQGTASDSGKSTLVTALCRYYANEGYKVFPFKSQNMASNSAYTEEGKEISRAQLTQAEAARRKADIRMNPIFLKPSSDTGSEVILNGDFYDHMQARVYDKFKVKLKAFLAETFHEIEEENDLILLEGAGSPAEINLRENDIVNMGMADIADCPVILVADIDLGGVFASIYGTIQLQKPEHKKRIKGIIINKFRGDVSLLQPGLDMIEELTGVPVIGVIPYMDIKIEEEDSVALKKMSRYRDMTKDIDIAVISLPKIANFSDLNSLKIQEDVSLRFVEEPSDFGKPDILIIPDSVNPKADLAWLREKNLDSYVKSYAAGGGRLLGLGNGLYFLADNIEDFDGQIHQGLSLLDFDAKIIEEKIIEPIIIKDHGSSIQGIRKRGADLKTTAKTLEIFQGLGLANTDKSVIGLEVIGIFDNVDFVREKLNEIRKEKILDPLNPPKESYKDFKDRQYDLLAEKVAQNIDMKRLNEIIFGD